MFEQEINDTIQRITRDVLQDRTVLPLTDILEESRIPERFKAFFGTEAHWWIYTESVARARDRRFDFAHPELGSLLSYLEQVQIKHARFERDDFLSVLDSAVKLTYNYLCRPQTTLKWYIFRGEPTKSIGETLLRMDAFIDYPYFRTVFSEWVDRKKEERPTFDSISAKEFERIIRRIDDQILLSCTIDDLLGLMTPLFDFVGKGDAHSIPIEAMIVFFDDKNIRKLVDFLEKERAHRAHVSRTSFVMLMEELLNTSDDEPDTDFSSVYQDDALDQVVREHLEASQGVVEESAAREMARTAAGSLNGGFTVSSVVAAPDSLPAEEEAERDEEDRWEEEREDLSEESAEIDSDDEATSESSPGDSEEIEEVKDPIPMSSSSSSTSTPPEFSIRERAEGLPDASATTEQERKQGEERGFFIDSDGTHGDPILDLLIEPADIDLMADTTREEREKDNEWVEVREVEEMRHPYDDETVEEVIAAIDERESQMLSAGEEEVEEEETGEEKEEAGEGGGSKIEDEDENAEEIPFEAQNSSVTADEGEEEEEPERGEVIDILPMEEVKEEEEFKLVDGPARSTEKDGKDHDGRATSRPDDVRNYIDAMLERKVVKKIFNRSRENYEATLDLLNNASTWRDASRILDELFILNDVDPYSRIAIRFTDSVYGRYLSPAHGA